MTDEAVSILYVAVLMAALTASCLYLVFRKGAGEALVGVILFGVFGGGMVAIAIATRYGNIFLLVVPILAVMLFFLSRHWLHQRLREEKLLAS